MDDPVELALELGEDRGQRLFELLGARAALREFRRVCATKHALRLFQAGEKDRASMRDRLMQRYELGRSTAYACIDAALNEFAKLSKFDRRSWTRAADNDSSMTGDGAIDE
jgi:hypothetical protein